MFQKFTRKLMKEGGIKNVKNKIYIPHPGSHYSTSLSIIERIKTEEIQKNSLKIELKLSALPCRMKNDLEGSSASTKKSVPLSLIYIHDHSSSCDVMIKFVPIDKSWTLQHTSGSKMLTCMREEDQNFVLFYRLSLNFHGLAFSTRCFNHVLMSSQAREFSLLLLFTLQCVCVRINVSVKRGKF